MFTYQWHDIAHERINIVEDETRGSGNITKREDEGQKKEKKKRRGEYERQRTIERQTAQANLKHGTL